MVKVVNKATKKVMLVNETFFKNHPTQFELFVEKKKVKPRVSKKKVVEPKKTSEPVVDKE